MVFQRFVLHALYHDTKNDEKLVRVIYIDSTVHSCFDMRVFATVFDPAAMTPPVNFPTHIALNFWRVKSDTGGDISSE